WVWHCDHRRRKDGVMEKHFFVQELCGMFFLLLPDGVVRKEVDIGGDGWIRMMLCFSYILLSLPPIQQKEEYNLSCSLSSPIVLPHCGAVFVILFTIFFLL